MKIGICAPISINSLSSHLEITNKNSLSYGLGGDSINKLIIALIKKGVKVSVFTLDKNINKPIILKGKNLDVSIFPLRGKIRLLDFYRKELFSLSNAINSSDIQLIHSHWSYEYAMAGLKSNKKTIVSVRDNAFKVLFNSGGLNFVYRFYRLLISYYVILRSKNLVSNSSYIQSFLKSFYFKESELIYNPSDVKIKLDYENYPKLKEVYKFISVNNGFSSLKNVIPLLRAFEVLKKEKKNLTLKLIGYQYEKDGKCYNWCKRNNVNINGITFVGKLDYNNLIREYKEHHVLVHPSKEESFGNTLIESMAFGLVCIGGIKSGAVPEILKKGKCGILVDVYSYESIREGMSKIIHNYELYLQLRKAGIVRSKEFQSNIIAEKHIKLYNKINENTTHS